MKDSRDLYKAFYNKEGEEEAINDAKERGNGLLLELKELLNF